MRHNVAGKRLGRTTNQRKALMKNLASALITQERIETTLVKAKELRKFVEPIITLCKKDTVANRRLAMSILSAGKATETMADDKTGKKPHKSNATTKTVVEKLFTPEFRARFSSRLGGYTRILKMDHRLGDAAEMALIELVDYTLPEPKAAEEAAEK